MRDLDVVIMDEATSNIDAESERLIEEATATLLAGRTAIVIAHRLSTIRSVDRILVLHDGALAEEGDHDTLPISQPQQERSAPCRSYGS